MPGFGKLGARGGFGSLGVLGGASKPGFVVIGARNNVVSGTTVSNPANGTTNFAYQHGFEFINKTGVTFNDYKVVLSLSRPVNTPYCAVKRWKKDASGSGYSFLNITADAPSNGGTTALFRCPPALIVGGVPQSFICDDPGSYPAGETPTLHFSGDGTGFAAHVEMFNSVEMEFSFDIASTVYRLEYPLGAYSAPFTFVAQGGSGVSRGGLLVSDSFLNLPIPAGGIGRLRQFRALGLVTPTYGAITKDGSNHLTGIPISTPGSGLWQPFYTFPLNSGGLVVQGAAKAFSYEGSVVYTEITTPGTYTGTPNSLMNYSWERIGITAGSPVGDQTNANTSTDQTNTAAGWTQLSTTQFISPYLLGRPASRLKCVAVIDASHGAGLGGGDSSGDENDNWGYWSRYFGRKGVGVLKRALPGDYQSSFNAGNSKFLAVARQVTGLTSWHDGLAYNDGQRGDAAATIKAAMLTTAGIMNGVVNNGHRYTLFPNSTSGDGYLSVGGQTVAAGWGPGGPVADVNDWLRDGAPLVGGSPVAVGTVGALRAGDAVHPWRRISDVCGQIEASLNSGTTQVINNLGKTLTRPLTTGVHMNTEGHCRVYGCVGAINQSSRGGGYTTAGLTMSGVMQFAPTIDGSNNLTGITVVDDGGIDFDHAPPIRILGWGGVGSGSATAVLGGVTGKRIATFTGVSGAGLSNGCLVSVAGITQPFIRAVVSSGGVDLLLDDPGCGIIDPFTLTVTGDGVGAAATVTIKSPFDLSTI